MICKRHINKGGWNTMRKPDFIAWLLNAVGPGSISWSSKHSDGVSFVATVEVPFGTFEGDACHTRRAAERSAALVALWHS